MTEKEKERIDMLFDLLNTELGVIDEVSEIEEDEDWYSSEIDQYAETIEELSELSFISEEAYWALVDKMGDKLTESDYIELNKLIN